MPFYYGIEIWFAFGQKQINMDKQTMVTFELKCLTTRQVYSLICQCPCPTHMKTFNQQKSDKTPTKVLLTLTKSKFICWNDRHLEVCPNTKHTHTHTHRIIMYSSPVHRYDTLACPTLIIIVANLFFWSGRFNTQDETSNIENVKPKKIK